MSKFVLSLPLLLSALSIHAAAESGRFVRIELFGEDRVLTLAEVEVHSGGKNVAPAGKATQSSVSHGGEAGRALDGNKHPEYGKGGQTHTDFERDPWWELDLGKSVAVDRIEIHNRGESFANRLDDFTVKLLDEDRKVVWARSGLGGPPVAVRLEVKKDGKVVFIDAKGKEGKEAPKAATVPEDYRDPAPFRFQAEDSVALIGNGLADRFQHDGWFETLLQAELAGRQVSFRNMAISGDRPDKFPRHKGFTNMPDYLRRIEADVVLAFFGYNESWDGIDKASEHRDRLVRMVKDLRSAQPNGESFPRFVLFSPIAFENTGDPNLPDGVAHNTRLAAYTEATRAAAELAGCAYVDLFTPTFQLFEASDERYTINGLHLNELGNRKVAEVIATALVGKPVAATDDHAELREAVLDKNWHWHHRYRATDGNDIWGGRSGLSFVRGQTNREVLQHEMAMLDIMTANRDEKVWAVASGMPYTIDDSNVPPPIPVESNVGGKSKSSNAQKEGSTTYLPPEESIKKMTVPEGYALNVFASEEMFDDLANPVQLQVDGKGRLWAASWNTYPKWEPLKEMNDSLMILPDEDGDGVADQRIIFANVHNPLGFEFWNGGVLVTCGPDLLYLKDTDGDDKADVRYVMLGGLDTSDTHHGANNLIYGPGGGIYWQSGVFMVHNHEHPWGPSLQTGASAMYRFDPRRHTIRFHAGNSPNPHGTSFDHWGYCYANDGTGGRSYQVRPEGDGFKMHTLLKKEVRPVAADQIVSSTHFPDEVQGNFIVCNTIGFLGLKNYKLHRDGYEDRKVGEVWGTPEEPFLVSEDRNFRPTDAVFGEDGALYIADWCNVIIGHMQHNIRDPNRDHVHGRVLRLSYPGRPRQAPVAIDGAPVAALLKNLEHPVVHVRQRTHVELSERDTREVIDGVKTWIKDFDPKNPEHAHHFLEALWVHQQHNVRDEELLAIVKASPVEHARIAAATVEHYWTKVDNSTANDLAAAAEAEQNKKVEVEVPAHLTGSAAALYKLGGEVFHRDGHCATCHQPHGKGTVGQELDIYPPLDGSPWVTGDEERLIKLTLHGLWGKIEVNGTTYDPAKGIPPMTAFGSLLTDEEVAGVLTYVRNTWGNKAAPVSPDTVKKVRAANTERTIFWKPEELLQTHPFPE